MKNVNDSVRALRWESGKLQVLDQRKLPAKIVYEACSTVAEVAEAIASMRVRGAPAIGIAAAYGVVLAAQARFQQSKDDWCSLMEADFNLLAASRPTAVNLFWALDRMHNAMSSLGPNPLDDLLEVAEKIHRDDLVSNYRMGEIGAAYFSPSEGVLTHCNTGSLATGGYGTALGVLRTAHVKGVGPIFATETRPWLQGARLTVWELNQDRIPATLIADSAAAFLMKAGKIKWVVVGADRIAANGDVANKIGTYALAVAARYHGVRFMVVAPTSTIDFSSPDGKAIEIEERDASELLCSELKGEESVISAWNPVFDVTPADLIDVLVTEKGAIEHPSYAVLAGLKD
jgi:methylthioribose-1-phosphate isomerase